MIYEHIIEGVFIERLNRFIAIVLINNQEERVHVKNTGRCQELFIKGARVFLEIAQNPNRKTKYSLIAIYKGDLLINIDSQIPNGVIFEAIKANKIECLKDCSLLRREVTWGRSRFDLYYEKGDQKGFIEVKGVTLERDRIACFPDAPTERGCKHVLELIEATKVGYSNYLCFLIQMEGHFSFTPNIETDPEFAKSLSLAKASGVGILCYNSIVTADSITLHQKLREEDIHL